MTLLTTASPARSAPQAGAPVPLVLGGPAAHAPTSDAAASKLAIRVERALCQNFDPHAELVVWGQAALIDAARLPRPGWRMLAWPVSPWESDAAGDLPAVPPGAQVLVLAEAAPTGPQAVRRLMSRLKDRGAASVVIVVQPGREAAVKVRHDVEAQAYDAGFRKSPRYYLTVDYEALHEETGAVVIALEAVPGAALRAYPLPVLREHRDLHMDMLREVGERSDAHVIRYQLAADLIRAGDRVLDSACGLGYGAYLLARHSACASVLGVDGSDHAVRYGALNFAAVEARLRFEQAWLPRDLAALPDASFDVIVSFETLEHIEDPQGLLAEFERLLRPEGRIIVSVPNDWADATGQDPNPHHLHVYTLDKLRQQFRRRFDATALHLQIASGCKARSNANRWTPMPRALREVPVDTRMPPDAEWWILAGHKPAARPAVDLMDRWYDGVSRPWSDSTDPAELGRGLVLAVNCVPEEADPAVPAFWRALSGALSARGIQLVIASTAPLNDPNLQVIDIPFQLTDFAARYRMRAYGGGATPESAVMDAARWYGCTRDEAALGLALASQFFGDLLQALRPSAVLGWQSTNPVSRVLRQCARAADLPFWSGERGWVRNTLMFDLAENNALGEVHLSLACASLRDRFTPSPQTLTALSTRAREATDLGRYRAQERIDGLALRAKLGIPADARVVALFTHGEPSLNALDNAAQRELHDLSSELLQQRLDAVTDELLARGAWLIVQEHPFNRSNGKTLRLRKSPRVIGVEENVSSVLDAADHYLFTLATLQFDAAFLDKSFGLLGRSALYRAGEPPLISDYADARAFLDAVMDTTAWPQRSARLRRDIAFLYENFLLDIEPAAVDASAQRWSEHLAQLVRRVDGGLAGRVDQFLGMWAAVD